jgi:hypothetical protein
MIEVSQHDLDLATRTIAAEARGEDHMGKIAVAYVMLNRLARPGWWSREKDAVPDDTLGAVCVDAWQFSGLNTNDPNLRYAMILPPTHQVYLECLAALLDALLGVVPDITDGATHYHVIGMPNPPAWASSPKMRQTFEHGRHRFFIEGA